jgi:quercetin dioxygenase-like cupin family protein
MEVLKSKDIKEVEVTKFPYRDKLYDVKGISIRWLSKTGKDKDGQPEYGLRFFTAKPGGEIPIHNHFYVQTMYIMSGQFECWRFDPETDELVEKVISNPGDSIYVPSMEPHGMRNLSETEPGTFLCCICNVYEDKTV